MIEDTTKNTLKILNGRVKSVDGPPMYPVDVE